MATPTDLARKFQTCLKYQQAASWRKPLLDPVRFLANQFRKYRLLGSKPGQLRTVASFHLPEFTIVTNEGVGEQIASYGIYEENLTGAFLRLVEPGQVVVDIGMHLGYYTTLFAILVGEKGEVHAFEPTPSTRQTAERNVHQFTQVTVHPEAVWSSKKVLTFQDYGPRWMAFNSFTAARMKGLDLKSQPFEAETITLDGFRATLKRPISLLKIDAESAEHEILLGGQKLLQSDQPLISLEVGDFENQTSSRRLIELLTEKDYAAWEFGAGHFRHHQPKQIYSYDNLIFAPVCRDLSPL